MNILLLPFKDASVMRLSKYTSYKYKEGEDWDNPDNDPRGPWMSANISRGVGKGKGGKKSFIITNPAGIQFDRNWAIDKEDYEELLKDNRIYFANNGRGVPRKKIFQNEPIKSIQSSIFENLKSSQFGKKEIKSLIGEVDFEYPKPTTLLKRIIQVSSKPGDIILDFFAGSCTLAHAIYDLNKDKKTQRKFICIQIPEAIKSDSKSYQLGFKTIAQLGLSRIKKVSQKISSEIELSNKLDFGCKVYKLSHSNFKKWQRYKGNDTKHLETLFTQYETSLIDDWKPENLLTEILLIEGFQLDSEIKVDISFKKNKIQKVTSDYCKHALYICLDKKLEDETIKSLSLSDNDIFICLDNSVTDQDKVRLEDKGLIKTI
jgi:adenine-specific DNA-methyltransferase